MSSEIVAIGDKLHVMTRRNFEQDVRRHFVGEVTAIDRNLTALHGHAFVFNGSLNEYRRLPEARTRILSLADAAHIVNLVPRETDIEIVHYKTIDKRVVVTDGQGFLLPVEEFGPAR